MKTIEFQTYLTGECKSGLFEVEKSNYFIFSSYFFLFFDTHIDDSDDSDDDVLSLLHGKYEELGLNFCLLLAFEDCFLHKFFAFYTHVVICNGLCGLL